MKALLLIVPLLGASCQLMVTPDELRIVADEMESVQEAFNTLKADTAKAPLTGLPVPVESIGGLLIAVAGAVAATNKIRDNRRKKRSEPV